MSSSSSSESLDEFYDAVEGESEPEPVPKKPPRPPPPNFENEPIKRKAQRKN